MARRCELTGVGVMSGNNVSKSNRRTKRTFVPNLKEVRFPSETLGNDVGLKVTAATLRTVNKYGGLDSFLVNYPFEKLTEEAKTLRRQIEKALKNSGKYENIKVIKKAEKKERAPKKRVVKKAEAKKTAPKEKTVKAVKVAKPKTDKAVKVKSPAAKKTAAPKATTKEA